MENELNITVGCEHTVVRMLGSKCEASEEEIRMSKTLQVWSLDQVEGLEESDGLRTWKRELM